MRTPTWLVAVSSLALFACSTEVEVDHEDDEVALTAGGKGELPWEIVSERGETLVPDVFYADDVQTEQIMPVAINGHVMINRMIYPTIGNPKLFDKSDANDSAIVALRLEDAILAHLHPKVTATAPTGHTTMTFDASDRDGVRVMLVARSARRATTEAGVIQPGNGVIPLDPSQIVRSPIPADMPEALKRRSTYRFVFRKDRLAQVPAGLYDVRVEVRKGGALAKLDGDREAAFEYQYNALRVFDRTEDEYPIVNLTDTQVSTGAYMSRSTETPFSELVAYARSMKLPEMQQAPFAVFEGDLHQAGAYTGVSMSFVLPEYANEMAFAIDQLKELPIPIHMVPGNHDGYASIGEAPTGFADTSVFTIFNKSLRTVVTNAGPGTWPDFDFDAYETWRKGVAAHGEPGGHALDLYRGSFTRKAGSTFTEAWREIPRPQRNQILYDGQYQWLRTIGPLHHSWRFRSTRFIGMNTYELRQHMRMGWGMYSANYGGGMGPDQLDWVGRELSRGDQEKSDVVLIAHHDPRGGKGHGEYGSYHSLETYNHLYKATLEEGARYAGVHQLCQGASLMSSLFAHEREEEDDDSRGCDEGKQIWMQGEPQFDRGYDSGVSLVKKIANAKNARTFLYAHTHFNGLEMLQGRDDLLPGQVSAGHELLALELGSCSSVTSSKFEGKKMYGFQILKMSTRLDGRGIGLPQINELDVVQNQGGGNFRVVLKTPIDRSRTMKRDDPRNPVNPTFGNQ